jgi:hypothetical protein
VETNKLKTMKVKIVKAVSSNWYFGKIGEEFEVVSEDAFIWVQR